MGKRDPIPPEKKPVECRFEQRKGGYCYCRTCRKRIKGKQAKHHRFQMNRAKNPLVKPAEIKAVAPLVSAESVFNDRYLFRCGWCRQKNTLLADGRVLQKYTKPLETTCVICHNPNLVDLGVYVAREKRYLI